MAIKDEGYDFGVINFTAKLVVGESMIHITSQAVEITGTTHTTLNTTPNHFNFTLLIDSKTFCQNCEIVKKLFFFYY